MIVFKGIKGKLRRREPLKKHTTFKIGGPADFFIEPKGQDDLKLLLIQAKKCKIPFSVIGAGSNILAGDRSLRRIVLHLNSPFFKEILADKDGFLVCGSGALLSQAVIYAKKSNLAGLEFLAGIPGTLGGALVMNAGAAGKSIGDLVVSVKVMDYDGNVHILGKDDCGFGYRHSNLSKYIVLGALLKLAKGNKIKITKAMNELLSLRKRTQDYSLPSAGCAFKNPPDHSAGRLIDLCGLKGERIGQACISNRHANFILNRGNATAGDVLRLMNLVKRRVRSKFNISLEPEIIVWK